MLETNEQEELSEHDEFCRKMEATILQLQEARNMARDQLDRVSHQVDLMESLGLRLNENGEAEEDLTISQAIAELRDQLYHLMNIDEEITEQHKMFKLYIQGTKEKEIVTYEYLKFLKN